MVEGLEDVLHAADVRRLLAEVELAAQRLRQVLNDRRQVEDAAEGGALAGLLDEHLEQAEVVHDVRLGGWALDLDDDAGAIFERGAVYLGDGAGGQRLRFDAGEDVLPGDAQLLLHGRDDLLLGQGRHPLLERL